MGSSRHDGLFLSPWIDRRKVMRWQEIGEDLEFPSFVDNAHRTGNLADL